LEGRTFAIGGQPVSSMLLPKIRQ